MSERTSAAVIGLGPAGLVMVKNLVEEGFDITGFERNSYIGGLWKHNTADQTSVMETAIVHEARERGCFTDFPYPDGFGINSTAAQVHEYLISFSKHFNLEPHFRLNTSIRHVSYDEALMKWVVDIEGTDNQHFDKVVIAIGGMYGHANVPTIEGLEKFKGTCVHSRQFKQPKEFQGKRVMVLGFANSAADTATQLAMENIASKVYLSHQHGSRIVPRRMDGLPFAHMMSMRMFLIQNLITETFPRLGEYMFNGFMKMIQNKCFKIRPEWNFDTKPLHVIPLISDNLVSCLENKSVESVKGIKRILGATTVELEDGRQIEVDAIIFCTGYNPDFSIIDPKLDPSCYPARWVAANGSKDMALFRLYQGIFSLEKPDSLAFLGNTLVPTAAMHMFDMAAQAITQVWKGASSLPALSKMEAAVEKHNAWAADRGERGTKVPPGYFEPGPWLRIMDDLAGTGMNENLGYGWRGWLFWLRNRSLCNMVMGGIWSPHVYRLFKGKRKAWDGARERLEEVNRLVEANKQRVKEESKKKTA